MKSMFFVFACMMLLLTVSCKKDSIVYSSQLEKSYKVWQHFKDSSQNNYSYQVAFTSWTNSGNETTITVRDGLVVGRRYQRTQATHTGTAWHIDTLASWVEAGAAVGIHAEGNAAVTLDEIYAEARNNWLKKRSDADTYFEAKNNGMISTCGYVPKNCADDCFRGIYIHFIKPE